MGESSQTNIMTKQLKWRLGKLPTPDEVLKLVNDKLITKEEARDILFNEEVETERDKESLEAEIKFLRDLVEKLSQNRTNTIEIIKQVEVPYYQYHWYKPYEVWCSNSNTTFTTLSSGETAGVTCGANNITSLGGIAISGTAGSSSFTDIQTF